MKTILCIIILALGIPTVGSADNIYSLITDGRLKEASDSLSRLATASTRDGNVLFFQSLMEQSADQAARMMEASLRSSVSLEYRPEIYYRLAQYYLIKHDYKDLSRVVNEYRASTESGKYDAEMLRLSVIVDQMSGDYESALKQADRFQVKYGTSETSQWGMVDKARILAANGKSIGAVKILKELSREKSGVGVPQALYLLAVDALEKKRIEDAVFYYNLLRDGYPGAIGLDALVDRLSSVAGGYDTGDTAEKLTGTYYTIKVGVFSSRDNANKQADLFKQYKKPVDIREKTISGRNYHVVYVGKFQSYQDAYQFKSTLEATHGEVYQVVAR